MGKIEEVIIHCSDSDWHHHDNIETITQWHLDRGFDEIGYHVVITQNGLMHFCRDWTKEGAHCYGHNPHSLGICLTGKTQFSKDQFEILNTLLKFLIKCYLIDPKRIHLHNEFNSRKTCPNFEMKLLFKPDFLFTF